MCSEAKRLANQKNAQSSTGPRTEAGKARSRQNAWKHGLAGAGLVEHDDDYVRLQERVELWTEDLEPTNAVEAWLIARAAKASFRLDRCAEKEAIEIGLMRIQAVERFEKSAREWVTQGAGKLGQGPAETVRSLQNATLGCDWLLARWELLTASLTANNAWTRDELALALNLLGQVVGKPNPASSVAESLRVNAFAARPERDPDEVDAFLSVSTKHLDPEARRQAIEASLPDRATAKTALAAIIAAEVEQLQSRRELIWEIHDQPALTEAANRASFDRCDEAILMQRYETAHSLDLHRCLGQLAKMRKAESAGENTPVVESQPVAEPAASPATPASAPIRNEPTAAGTDGQQKGSVSGNGSKYESNSHSREAKRRAHKRSSRPKGVVETSASVSALT